jgi:plasmid stabilization system protein ParE
VKIIWSTGAWSQKEAIWDYLAEFSVEYADRFEGRLLSRTASLARLPRQGRPLVKDIRRLSITDIQYTIDYRIDEDAVRILRVRSTAQDEKE